LVASPVQVLLNAGKPEIDVSADGTNWSSIITSPVTTSLNTWNHVVAQRRGNVGTIYINGVSVITGSITVTPVVNTADSMVGSDDMVVTWPLNGYIDDFRITKGVARYRENFTPPQSLPTS